MGVGRMKIYSSLEQIWDEKADILLDQRVWRALQRMWKDAMGS